MTTFSLIKQLTLKCLHTKRSKSTKNSQSQILRDTCLFSYFNSVTIDALLEEDLITALLDRFRVDLDAGVERGEDDVVVVPLHAEEVGSAGSSFNVNANLIV